MKARERFRAPATVKLREEDAGDTPLRDCADGSTLSRDEIKLRERTLTTGLTEQIAVCQEMLYAQRKQKLLIVLQGWIPRARTAPCARCSARSIPWACAA